ncbi:MAG: hypothetical protein HYS74_02740 [Parcubacteria group bacterium]|nr:hypothetical protein [Parcubacteria group bacterium]
MMARFCLLRVCFVCFSAILASGCGAITPSRSEFTGATQETIDRARVTLIGSSSESLEKRGISADTPGVREIPYTSIPAAILGERLAASYKELLTSETRACLDLKKRCRAYVVERRMRALDNIASTIPRLLNIKDHYVGEEEHELVILIIEDDIVVDAFITPHSRKPIETKDSDWLRPFKGVTNLRGLTNF